MQVFESYWFSQLTLEQQQRYRLAADMVKRRACKKGYKWVLGKYSENTKHALVGSIYQALDYAAWLTKG